MARVRRPALRRRTVAGEYIVRRAEQAKRDDPSLTYREIAQSFGMNERTLRKLRTGETSGRQLFRAARKPPPGGRSPDLYTLVLHRPDGGWARVNVVVPRRTRFDIYAIAADPKVRAAVDAELNRRAISDARRRRGSDEWNASLIAGTTIDKVQRDVGQRVAPLEIFER